MKKNILYGLILLAAIIIIFVIINFTKNNDINKKETNIIPILNVKKDSLRKQQYYSNHDFIYADIHYALITNTNDIISNLDSVLDSLFCNDLKDYIDTFIVLNKNPESLFIWAIYKNELGIYEIKDKEINKYILTDTILNNTKLTNKVNYYIKEINYKEKRKLIFVKEKNQNEKIEIIENRNLYRYNRMK